MDAALEAMEDAEAEGNVPEGMAAKIRAQLKASAAETEAWRKRATVAEDTVKLHEVAARGEGSSDAVERKLLRKKLRAAEAKANAPPMSYERLTSKAFAGSLDEWIYFSNAEVLDAWLAMLHAIHPLDQIEWIDTNVREGEPPKKKRRSKFPLAPRDAVCLWLMVLRVGFTFKRAAKLFGVSKQTARRAFVTMTALHRQVFEQEFFEFEELALRAIIPEMMRTFQSYEGYEGAVVHIIDAFEKVMQKPSDDEAAVSWSNYKHNYTAKSSSTSSRTARSTSSPTRTAARSPTRTSRASAASSS